MTVQGIVLEVSSRPVQYSLDVDEPTGSTALVLTHVDNLPASGTFTGQIQPDPDEEPIGFTILYSSFDATTLTVTLSAPTTVDLLQGDILTLSPMTVEKWATVEVDPNDDAILALVPQALYDRLAEGVREAREQEVVVIDQLAGDWVVADVLGTEARVDSQYINVTPDSILGDSLGDLASAVNTNTREIEGNSRELALASLTAYAGAKLASTADGRVAMSDYDPSTSDVNYYATDNDGELIRALPFAVDNRSVTSNVASLSTPTGGVTMAAGQLIIVEGLGAPFDGVQTVSTVDADSVEFAVINADISALAEPLEDPVFVFNTFFLQRTEGSIWFTRTRSRINYVSNPSFEVDVADWTASQCSMLREAVSPIAGSYTMKVTNNGTPGNHTVMWDNGGGALRQPAGPGQVWTASVYALAVSGGNANAAYLGVEFFDASLVSLGAQYGPSAFLSSTDWKRYWVTATAPVNTAYVTLRMSNPNDSAVWRVDAALLEASALLGRYFDGRTYDAAWSGTADDSSSNMTGGKIIKAYELDDGAWIEKLFSGYVLTDIDASKIKVFAGTNGLDGEVIADYSIPLDKLSGTPVVASEALTAGNLVNIHNSTGLFRMRKAKADPTFHADGYILADTASGAIGMLYSFGYNPFMTGLSPGQQFLSTTAGTCSSSPPSTVGKLHQKVGVAAGATVLNFTPGNPVRIT